VADLPSASRVLQIDLVDHLTARALGAALAPVDEWLRTDVRSLALVIDCRRMKGYEGDARALFVQWNKANRPRIERVAIVTDNALYRMVISAMALASQQDMRAFGDVAGARAWAGAVDFTSAR